eukprot:CAMPEP_0197574646 /NCGR_PEP_ID=MMETSP1326-20131121/316_1 /TAXON_ID=1155430 /ORGANISM="Genus nov. species nov., Strain RCC2288" /LENGTH=189 /DNA_ID=CAMNT_0043137271 /DNA_START=228 /DNA_END=797 /DNA_ORIENTATION=-
MLSFRLLGRVEGGGLDLSKHVADGAGGHARVQPTQQLRQHLRGYGRQQRSQLLEGAGRVGAAGPRSAPAASAAPEQEVKKLGDALHRRLVLRRDLRRQPHAGGQQHAGQQQRQARVAQAQLHQHARCVVAAQRVDALHGLVQQELAEEGSLGRQHELKRLARLRVPVHRADTGASDSGSAGGRRAVKPQ